MTKLKESLKTFVEPSFWIDALTIIAGYKVSDLTSAVVGSRLPGPAALKPFVGPVIVVTASALMTGKASRIGRNLRLGAFVHAADQLLDLAGLPTMG